MVKMIFKFGIAIVIVAIYYTNFIGNIKINGSNIRLFYLIIVYLVFIIIGKIDGRLSAVIAVSLFSSGIFFVIVGDSLVANRTTETAHIFFTIGAVWLVAELMTEKLRS